MAIALFSTMAGAAEVPVQFNTDVLDVQDRAHIDLSQFSRAGFIMPGTYSMIVQVNKDSLPEQPVSFMVPDDDPKGSDVCLTQNIVSQLGLKDDVIPTLTWWHRGACLALSSLKGASARGDLGGGVLYVTIPKRDLGYSGEDWTPPSRWDDGVPGVLLDYNMTTQMTRQQRGERGRSVSGNGVAGANIGPWRLRADWQAQDDRGASRQKGGHLQTTWSRVYLYRAVRRLRAKLTAGENYLSSGLFASFRYAGVGLESDDAQLPPNLRGYAPEVTGVARTNAKVTISQKGRVIYDTTVAEGPFRIQELSSAVSGILDVRVEEQDGSVQTFSVNTADIPYLTRPGTVRYKVATGKATGQLHGTSGPAFGTGEFAWGISNGWSLYGGAMVSEGYHAMATGVGRDLLALGALSFDVTTSRVQLSNRTAQGRSWRLSYSKRFEQTDSQVTFAGYRFSTRDYMTLSQFLDARHAQRDISGRSKQAYTLTFNQQFPAMNTSVYLSYNRNTYWDRQTGSTYSLSLSRYVDLGCFKNVSRSVSATRSIVNEREDNGVYLGVTVPWGADGSLSYDTSLSGKNVSHAVGYYNRINPATTYRMNGGADPRGNVIGNGYLTHEGEQAEITVAAGWHGSQSSSLGMSLRGGMTATPWGAALHRVGLPGGTRMMLDTAGVKDVPVRTNGADTQSNAFGKAVVSDVSSYWRTSQALDLDKLGDDVEASHSVVSATLTEGAIGYRQFAVIAGKKAMAVLTLTDGSTPPFGAVVQDKTQTQVGMVSDDGSVWLSGMRAGEVMAVSWDGAEQCRLTLPSPLPVNLEGQALRLPCRPLL